MDVDLPVWTIRPNWKGGVLERLEWLTDVLASDSGVEQRRAVRLSPRRSFEITVNPTRADRSYLDLILHRMGSDEWLAPLWHDQARMADDAAVGSSRLDFDNRFREFTNGGLAILYHDTFTWEVVGVESQDEDGINLTEPLTLAWSRRHKVFPLRRATIQTETTLTALTTRVGQSVLLFQVNEANDYPEAIGDDMVIYNGSPLLTRAPNLVQGIDTSHTRLFDEQDGQIGLRHRTDLVGRAFAVQAHNWQVRGREAQSSFRSFLYTLRGRQRMVWLPTYGDDVILSRPAAAGAVQVTIEKIGYRYVGAGSPVPGRAMLWTGQEVVKIATVPALPGGQEERFGLLAPLGANYREGASWGFLQPARLDQDTIEIHHHADSDGTFEVGAGFKTFTNARDGSGSNFNPIPVSNFLPGECGAPAGSNPCKYIPFSGVYLSISLSAPNPCNPGWDGDCYCNAIGAQPNGGQVVGGFHFTGRPAVFNTYEFNDPTTNPAWQGQLLQRLTVRSFNDWTAEYFYPGAAFSGVYIKPSARYCGSVGKDEGTLMVSVVSADGSPTFYGPNAAGGNYDIYFP